MSKKNKTDCDKLAFAAKLLVDQLDVMRNAATYQSIFEIAALNHGIIYTGPNCPTFGVQLENLRKELKMFYNKNDTQIDEAFPQNKV